MPAKTAAALSISSLAMLALSLYPSGPPRAVPASPPEEDALSQALARTMLREIRGLLRQGRYGEAQAILDDYLGPRRLEPPGPGGLAAAGGNEELGLLYRRAAASYSRGDYLEASRLLRRILAARPRHEGARRYLRKIETLLHRPEGGRP